MSDHQIAERTKLVNDRLVFHFEDIGCVLQPMSKFEWTTAQLEDPSNLHRPYGWVPPFEGKNGDEFAIFAPYCPSLIAEQTVDLDDGDFDSYLSGIEFITALQIANRNLPWQERERVIEARVWTEGEDTLRLMSAVQMAVLDKMHGS